MDHTPDFARVFEPRGIALVGGSPNLKQFGGRLLQVTTQFTADVRVVPVNPKYGSINGTPCYPDIASIPADVAIDHVGISVPAASVVSVLRDCERRGIPFATVFSGGFAEVGTEEGRRLGDELREFSQGSRIRIIGPNSNGMLNYWDRIAITSTHAAQTAHVRPGAIGIASQSGGLAQINVMWQAQDRGLGIGYEMSSGNDSDMTVSDFITYMAEDPRISVILAIIEGIKDFAGFQVAALAAAQARKPIVMLKLGRSQEGRDAAASHTASITGSDDIFDAAFQQLGVIRVDDFDELYETAMVLQQGRLPDPRSGIGAASVSGGNIVHLADCIGVEGLPLARLDAATNAALASTLPGEVSPKNPLDMTTLANRNPTFFAQCLDALANDPNVGTLLPALTVSPTAVIDKVREQAAGLDQPYVLLWTGFCSDGVTKPADLVADGVPVFTSTVPCLKAVKRMYWYSTYLADRAESEPAPGPSGTIDLQSVIPEAVSKDGVLGERESLEVLRALGLPAVESIEAGTAEQAVAAAGSLGYPVVLKLDARGLGHKTEIGGVVRDLRSPGEVERAHGEILDRASREWPDHEIRGVLVQPMVVDAMEVLVGMVSDPVIGPVTALAAGGTAVESTRDARYGIGALTMREASRMVEGLQMFPQLHVPRRGEPYDVNGLAEFLVRFSAGSASLAQDFTSFEINPVMVRRRGRGVVAVDALGIGKFTPSMPA